MPLLPLPTQSNPQEYREQGDERLINCFAEQIAAKKYRVRRSPGYTLFSDDAGQVNCRGAIEADGTVYAVFEGGATFAIASDGTRTNIGHIGGQGPVMMARNAATPFQIGVVVPSNGRYYVIENNAVSVVDTRDVAGFNSITWVGGYFFLGVSDGRFFNTGLNDARSISGLDYGVAEGAPDGLVGVFSNRLELVLFGTRTTEFWGALSDPGAQGSPFTRLGGAVIDFGCASILSAVQIDNSFMWVGHDGVVYRAENYNAIRVSHYGVERSIAAQADKSKIRAFAFDDDGNKFYRLIGDDFTWTFNAATRKWHEERSLTRNRLNAHVHVEAWGGVYCFTEIDGGMYRLDPESNTENGAEFPVVIRFSDIPGRSGIVHSFEADFITGRAKLTGAQVETSPVAVLSWSDDGGASWSGYRELGVGGHGGYAKRVRALRLGRVGTKWGRRFELRITDPHVVSLTNAMINEGVN